MARSGVDWQDRILLLERRVATLRRSRRVLLELLAYQQATYQHEVDRLQRRVAELERQRQRLLRFIRRRRVVAAPKGAGSQAAGGSTPAPAASSPTNPPVHPVQ